MKIPVYIGFGSCFDGEYEMLVVQVSDDTPKGQIENAAEAEASRQFVANDSTYRGKTVEFIKVGSPDDFEFLEEHSTKGLEKRSLSSRRRP
jgi:hypothetical protein